MFKKLFLTLCVWATIIAACGAAPSSVAPKQDYFDNENARTAGGDGMTDRADYAAPSAEEQAATGNSGAVQRLVIKNAQLAIVVIDPPSALTSLSQMAEAMGGYVVSSNTYQARVDAEGQPILRAALTIRVPVEKLAEALAQIKAQALEVQSENISGQDVTAEYTDLESRLKNLEAAEAQLQKIMEGATKTEDVLAVYSQLVATRGEIEMIKGQMQYYRDAAALSSITLDLIPDALYQPIDVGGWKPQGVAKDAIEALVRTLQNIADQFIYGTLYCLPLGLLFGLPVLFFGRWAWRKWRNRRAPSAAKTA
jgi:hypothetical protein